MSINENQEFETINRMSSDRANTSRLAVAEVYRARKARMRKQAAWRLVIVAAAALALIAGCNGLEMIGWINGTFNIVLQSLAGGVAMFVAGYCWHEIKN